MTGPRHPLPVGKAPKIESTLWMDEAICRGKEDLFYPNDGTNEGQDARDNRERDAKRICARCPVREDCLEWALFTQQVEGVWGGKNWEERKKLIRYRRAQGRVA